MKRPNPFADCGLVVEEVSRASVENHNRQLVAEIVEETGLSLEQLEALSEEEFAETLGRLGIRV